VKKLKEGDLVELTELPGGYYNSLEHTYGIGRGQIGVVTRIINHNMSPTLVEVAWSSGNVLKYYSDDLIAIESKKD
tara:strand:- start:131 stop:358 length:228 start_codon:yes stop_codon:yes gene_type:complete